MAEEETEATASEEETEASASEEATEATASEENAESSGEEASSDTEVAEGKETREFEGKHYVLEKSLTADFAFVKAWKGDVSGNLVYRGTSRNFNPMMAMAGKITIAEVEELVDVGELDPNEIHTPGIFVQRIYKGLNYQKRIEF